MKSTATTLAALGAFAALSTATPFAGGELTTNGGFEAGDTSSWQYFPSPSSTFDVSMDANTGSFSGQLMNDALASAAVIKQANLAVGVVAPGDMIDISFAAKGGGVAGGVLFGEFFSEGASGVSSQELLGGGPIFPGSDWQTFSFTVTAGADVANGITLQFAAVTGAATGSAIDVLLDDVSVTIQGASGFGTIYCTPNAVNSSGNSASMSATGVNTGGVAADYELTITVTGLPTLTNQAAYLLASPNQAMIANPGGSQGTICITSPHARLLSSAQILSGGMYTHTVDLTNITFSTAGPSAVQVGDTLNFQLWYRDLNPGQTNNFSDAVSITFN